MSIEPGTRWGIALVACLSVLALFLMFDRLDGLKVAPPVDDSVTEDLAPPQIEFPLPLDTTDEKAIEARQLQRNGAWSEADAAWREVESDLSGAGDRPALREEARRNRDALAERLTPTRKPVDAIHVDPQPDDSRPRVVTPEKIKEFYPVGKTVRSLAYSNTSGEGENRRWLFRGMAHFVYQYRLAIETTVVENRGTAVVFEQVFREVSQLRADSDQEVEWSPPDSPLLALLWKELDENVLPAAPYYAQVKKGAEIASVLDPRGRRSLTWLHERLKKLGVKLDDSDEVELVTQIEKLQGLKLRIEYVSGLGVTEIRVLDGKTFDPDDLSRLAHNSSLFMDYFVSEAAGVEPGEDFSLRAEDVGGMFAFGYDAQAEGALKGRRSSDESASTDDRRTIEITGGELTLRFPRKGSERTVTVRPQSGFLRYSTAEFLTREGRVTWLADDHWAGEWSLLANTEKTRNLRLETRYEAEPVAADSVPPGGEPTK